MFCIIYYKCFVNATRMRPVLNHSQEDIHIFTGFPFHEGWNRGALYLRDMKTFKWWGGRGCSQLLPRLITNGGRCKFWIRKLYTSVVLKEYKGLYFKFTLFIENFPRKLTLRSLVKRARYSCPESSSRPRNRVKKGSI